MGNSKFEPPPGHGWATGVFCRGYVENKGDILAPQVGFEPTTLRLTAECSTVELLRSKCASFHLNRPVLALSNHLIQQFRTWMGDHHFVHQHALLSHYLRRGVHRALH